MNTLNQTQGQLSFQQLHQMGILTLEEAYKIIMERRNKRRQA